MGLKAFSSAGFFPPRLGAPAVDPSTAFGLTALLSFIDLLLYSTWFCEQHGPMACLKIYTPQLLEG
jgi:hypothetical protein